MEEVLKKLQEATDAVFEAQGENEYEAALVLSSKSNEGCFVAYHGSGFAIAALMVMAMEEEESLFKIMKAAVMCIERKKKGDE